MSSQIWIGILSRNVSGRPVYGARRAAEPQVTTTAPVGCHSLPLPEQRSLEKNFSSCCTCLHSKLLLKYEKTGSCGCFLDGRNSSEACVLLRLRGQALVFSSTSRPLSGKCLTQSTLLSCSFQIVSIFANSK